MKENLFIIIPLHNEEEILEKNIIKLKKIFYRILLNNNFYFMLVDNDSSDRTQEVIQKLMKNYNILSTFCPKPNYGKALKYGIKALSNKNPSHIFFCDIEQWDEVFFKWAWKNKNKFDISIGTKRSDYTLYKSTKIRYILSWGLNSLINLCFKYPGTDIHGPKLINKKIYKNIIPSCDLDRGQYDVEFVLKSFYSGYKIAEAPVIYKEYRKARINILKRIIYNIFAFLKLRKKLINYSKKNKIISFNQFSRKDMI